MRPSRACPLLVILLLAPSGGACDAAAAEGATPAGPKGWVESLPDLATLEALADDSGALKYLARVAGREPPEGAQAPCYFQDMAIHPFHLEFLHGREGLDDLDLDDYEALVLSPLTRVWWGGEVRSLGSGGATFTLWESDADGLSTTPAQVIDARDALAACSALEWSFTPLGADQEALAEGHPDLAAAGIEVVPGL